MTTNSYGILVYKQTGDQTLVLLAHPSGPFWSSKDSWTIPKGEPEKSDQNELATAKREFIEETGLSVPDGEWIDLGEVKQSSIKTNHIWAISGDPDLSTFSSNSFELEWPPHSGKMQSFYENDRIEWFDTSTAKTKLFINQREFIDRLMQEL